MARVSSRQKRSDGADPARGAGDIGESLWKRQGRETAQLGLSGSADKKPGENLVYKACAIFES
jgi:hypothetical protein